jgi:glucose-1-phosphate thymidylyltransferase
MVRKGVILAGGKGTRLNPCTLTISKQLLPVFDKPMIYYPLSTLMMAGVTEILVISTPRDCPQFEALLGDGEKWGIRISYALQAEPRGLADAFIIGAEFIAGDPVCLILGDNIFYGHGFSQVVAQLAAKHDNGAQIFGYRVRDARPYGVVTVDKHGVVDSLEEKPQHPRSSWAVPGLYFYDAEVSDMARDLKPSARGELEITDLNRAYMAKGKLTAQLLGRGTAWLDLGTFEGLLDAANFVRVIEERQGLKICCPEEVAWRMGLINDHALADLSKQLSASDYGRYLSGLLEQGRHLQPSA